MAAVHHERKFMYSISLASTYGFGSTYYDPYQEGFGNRMSDGAKSVTVEYRGRSMKPCFIPCCHHSVSDFSLYRLMSNEFEVWLPIFSFMFILL